MKKIFITFIIAFFGLGCLFAQNDTVVLDRTAKPAEPAPAEKPAEVAKPAEKKVPKKNKTPLMKKLYFGGSFGATFGTYSSIRINPLIGYKLTPKLSVGVKFQYEHIKNKQYSTTYEYNNYGGSFFARFRLIKALYLHAEYAMMSFEMYDPINNEMSSNREMVPFLFLGGGYSKRLAGNSWLNFQILFDVINHSNSPYRSNEPFYSVGVGVGF